MQGNFPPAGALRPPHWSGTQLASAHLSRERLARLLYTAFIADWQRLAAIGESALGGTPTEQWQLPPWSRLPLAVRAPGPRPFIVPRRGGRAGSPLCSQTRAHPPTRLPGHCDPWRSEPCLPQMPTALLTAAPSCPAPPQASAARAAAAAALAWRPAVRCRCRRGRQSPRCRAPQPAGGRSIWRTLGKVGTRTRPAPPRGCRRYRVPCSPGERRCPRLPPTLSVAPCRPGAPEGGLQPGRAARAVPPGCGCAPFVGACMRSPPAHAHAAGARCVRCACAARSQSPRPDQRRACVLPPPLLGSRPQPGPAAAQAAAQPGGGGVGVVVRLPPARHGHVLRGKRAAGTGRSMPRPLRRARGRRRRNIPCRLLPWHLTSRMCRLPCT